MNRIAAWFRGLVTRGGGETVSPTDKIYLLDGASLSANRGDRNPMPPREVISWIQRLEKFNQLERIHIAAMFPSEPLRKAPDGAEFGGLEIYYAENLRELPEAAGRLIQKLRRGRRIVTVITSDAVLEQRAQSLGCPVMRTATFRKALDMTTGAAPREREGSSDRRGNRRRARPPRNGAGGAEVSPDVATAAEPASAAVAPEPSPLRPDAGDTPEKPPPVSDEIRKLIDPVE